MLFEALVVGVAGLIVRRRFDHDTRANEPRHSVSRSRSPTPTTSTPSKSRDGSANAVVPARWWAVHHGRRWRSSTTACARHPGPRAPSSSSVAATSDFRRCSARSIDSASSRSNPPARSRCVSSRARPRVVAARCSNAWSRANHCSPRRRARPTLSDPGRTPVPSPSTSNDSVPNVVNDRYVVSRAACCSSTVW